MISISIIKTQQSINQLLRIANPNNKMERIANTVPKCCKSGTTGVAFLLNRMLPTMQQELLVRMAFTLHPFFPCLLVFPKVYSIFAVQGKSFYLPVKFINPVFLFYSLLFYCFLLNEMFGNNPYQQDFFIYFM